MSELLFDVSERIATITLNSPEKLNAFTTDMLLAWGDALLEAQRRDDVRVIVLTGAGRAFCSGGDVGSIGERREAENAYMRKVSLSERVHRIPLIMETLDKPVIVAVNGVATGAGMDMALMGDIRIASSTARFAETYIRIGIMAGDGGAWYLPRLVGMPRALELLWTGRFVEAEEAERIGLVNHVVPEAELMPRTMEMAGKIANGPPLAIRMMKRAAYQGVDLSLRAHLDQVSSHMGAIFSTEDHKEALAAFREKRAPVFVGR
ncbi:enoyl-CoA hydratase/isomerase family protein [Cupriavidus sp. L7L]|uniref:enoyl-CoA hydratase/isomerase family protein n=1 Tax=Cupriavidus sp. L7L TaxID=2546443 RepID=UPI0010563E88|nr:enoyl-CoA hydratase-related protein [Cupriavidus sp. L7L]TDF62135.1 enoyl-CoA hydratase [Cupriavidus sp. L7L]